MEEKEAEKMKEVEEEGEEDLRIVKFIFIIMVLRSFFHLNFNVSILCLFSFNLCKESSL